MKKKSGRLLAALLALVLTAALLVPAASAEGPTLVAVNDSLPYDLSDATMPFYSDRQYYVPYTVFENSSLGIYVSYDREEKILTLFNAAASLSFYLSTLATYDISGNSYNAAALSKGGVTFVPVRFVCEQFKISCTITEMPSYMLIRITNGAQSYSNQEFIQQARSLITSKIEKYQESAYAGPEESSGQTTDPQTPPGTARAVLWIDASGYDGQSLAEALDRLEERQVPAAVFLDAAEEYDGDILRRIYAQGHRMGFAAASLEEAQAANDRLFAETRSTTRFLYYTGEEDVSAAGYISCRWDREYSDYVYASGLANSLEGDKATLVRFDLSEAAQLMLSSVTTHSTGKNGARLSFVSLRENMSGG